jgi:hypothetical protein
MEDPELFSLLAVPQKKEDPGRDLIVCSNITFIRIIIFQKLLSDPREFHSLCEQTKQGDFVDFVGLIFDFFEANEKLEALLEWTFDQEVKNCGS